MLSKILGKCYLMKITTFLQYPISRPTTSYHWSLANSQILTNTPSRFTTPNLRPLTPLFLVPKHPISICRLALGSGKYHPFPLFSCYGGGMGKGKMSLSGKCKYPWLTTWKAHKKKTKDRIVSKCVAGRHGSKGGGPMGPDGPLLLMLI